MNVQPDRTPSRDDDDVVDHVRLERLIGRRAHKAATYRRILVTRSHHMASRAQPARQI